MFWTKTAELLRTINPDCDNDLAAITSADYFFLFDDSNGAESGNMDIATDDVLNAISTLENSGEKVDIIVSYNVLCFPFIHKDAGIDFGQTRQTAKQKGEWEWVLNGSQEKVLSCLQLKHVCKKNVYFLVDCFNPNGPEFDVDEFKIKLIKGLMVCLKETATVAAHKGAI